MALSSGFDTLGYYTVCESERTGWTGGLLVLNPAGRPLEFQCTLPVRPSRAHEILYGPTLREYLIGSVIAPVLLEKCRTPLSLLCCDQPEAMGLQRTIDVPVALAVEAAEHEEGPITSDMLDNAASIVVAGGHLCVAEDRMAEVQMLASRLTDFPDLIEPFERIREAIREAHAQLARAA